MGAFGTVIPVTGLNNGYLGQVSRTGGGDPFIVSKLANALNTNNISFGDTVVILPDATGGTYMQFADFIANGGHTVTGTLTSASSTTATILTGFNSLQVGMYLFGVDIPAGTYIVSMSPTTAGAGTIVMSQASTGSVTAENFYAAVFGGIAVREVKTQLQFLTLAPGGSEVGYYAPGQFTESLVRGSITVKIYNGIPISNGPVYIRAATNSSFPNGIVGGLEAQADGVKNILLTNVTFKTGTLDGNNVSEVTLLDRLAA